jgi:hypothetical protein
MSLTEKLAAKRAERDKKKLAAIDRRLNDIAATLPLEIANARHNKKTTLEFTVKGLESHYNPPFFAGYRKLHEACEAANVSVEASVDNAGGPFMEYLTGTVRIRLDQPYSSSPEAAYIASQPRPGPEQAPPPPPPAAPPKKVPEGILAAKRKISASAKGIQKP